MNGSPADPDVLAEAIAASQHGAAPRPLPLFLDLIAGAARTDPGLARRALAGLRAFQLAGPPDTHPARPAVAAVEGSALRDCGGPEDGPRVVLVPSLINPPDILDLDPERSLAGFLAQSGLRVFLIDWGPADRRSDLDIDGHIVHRLLPLLDAAGAGAALVGYCLGGTMALAAAGLRPVARVATLASPWHFSAYPAESRQRLDRLWRGAEPTAQRLGLLPMEVLQSAFWAMDPERIVAKFAAFAGLDPTSAEARRFVALERWANEGEPLPYPAAKQLIEQMFAADAPGRGRWTIGGRECEPKGDRPPLFHLTASGDRICPPSAAPMGLSLCAPTGHVGLVIGERARRHQHLALARFLRGQPVGPDEASPKGGLSV